MNEFSTYTARFDTATVPGLIQIKVTELPKKSLKDTIDLKNIYVAERNSTEWKWTFSDAAGDSRRIKVEANAAYSVFSTKPFQWLTPEHFTVLDEKNDFVNYYKDNSITVDGSVESGSSYYLVFSWADENHIGIDIQKED